MKLLVVIMALVAVGESRINCIKKMNKVYKDSENNVPSKENVNKWKYAKHYDYFGNVTSEAPLSLTSPMSDLEGPINKQINKELYAHYTYLSMAFHFNRDDISLPGFHKFFKMAAKEESEHAQQFMSYLTKRGGRVKLHDIPAPCRDHWGNGLMAMEDALALEKEILKSLHSLHQSAQDQNDAQMADFIEGTFLNEQMESIKIISNYVNTLKRLGGGGLGEFQFDKQTLQA